MSERLRGRIRWFSHQKRYGRIQLGSGLLDIFVQIGDLMLRASTGWQMGSSLSSASSKRQQDP